MGAEDGRPTAAECERRLELAADGQTRLGEVDRQSDRLRGIPARPPDRRLAAAGPADHPRHRVVAADVDRPVVGQEQVRDPTQPADGFVVAVGDRLVGPVPAGHHQRAAAYGLEQQVV